MVDQLRWQCTHYKNITRDELFALTQLREEVFVVEQNVVYADIEDCDRQAHHLFGWGEEGLQAYLRLLSAGTIYPDSVSMGRILTAPAVRGQGLGRPLVRQGIEHAKSLWPGMPIRISAQAHLEAFYQSCGFETISDVYDEVGIPHIAMRRI